jgi:hypothetical protein
MTKILHKRSSTIGSAPTTASIDLGELAINTTDGKLFLKKSGSIGESIEQAITTGASNQGTVNLTGSLILSPTSSVGAQNALDVTVQTLDFDFDTLAFNGTSSFTGPYSVTSSAVISGSLTAIGTTTLSGSLSVQSGITGSLFGTSSWAVNAQTASLAPNYVLTSVTSSMSVASASLAATASFITGSRVVGTVTSASYALTASFALNGGGGGSSFPFTGSAIISGSLTVTGSTNLNGNFNLNTNPSTSSLGPGLTTNLLSISSSQVNFDFDELEGDFDLVQTGSQSVTGAVTASYFKGDGT